MPSSVIRGECTLLRFPAFCSIHCLISTPCFERFDEEIGGHTTMLGQSPPPGKEDLDLAPARPLPSSVEGTEAPRVGVSSSVVSDFQATARVIIELCSKRIRQMAYPSVSIIELGELVDVSVCCLLTLLLVGHQYASLPKSELLTLLRLRGSANDSRLHHKGKDGTGTTFLSSPPTLRTGVEVVPTPVSLNAGG